MSLPHTDVDTTVRPLTSGALLARTMNARSDLGPIFADTWTALSRKRLPADLEIWAGAVLRLVEVNCGPTVLMAYWRVSVALSDVLAVTDLCGAGEAAADVCRTAGARAAARAIEAFGRTATFIGSGKELELWWGVMRRLASEAPESLGLVCRQAETLMAHQDVTAFQAFVSSGLRSGGNLPSRRIAFFSLSDPTARRLLERRTTDLGLSDLEAELKAFLAALWGVTPNLRALPSATPGVARRANISGPLIRLPDVYRGVRGEASRLLYRAAAAHASAHLALGRGPFRGGRPKPLQIALVGLIEDARIEALAIRRYPGLRRLWALYHVAEPRDGPIAASLLPRISRALFDASYVDDDAIVAKSRVLFDEAVGYLDDPAISRDIGGRITNDFGQRRIQFDARAYVVEPLYRDDGFGLWDFDDESSPQQEEELQIEAVRVERQQSIDRTDQIGGQPHEDQPAASARPIEPSERGQLLGTHPEWDEAEHVERPRWVSVRDFPVMPSDPRDLLPSLDAAAGLRSKVARLVRAARVGRVQRLKRQPDGHDLDLDALVDAAISMRSRRTPDERVFRSSAVLRRDLGVSVLIDMSESTRARLSGVGASVLQMEKIAVAILAETMQALGDRFALHAFASNGRDDVGIASLKSFVEPYGPPALARLVGLKAGFSTRLGAALRHVGGALAEVPTYRKLLLVLTDGEPSDIDVPDVEYLTADARHAVLGLKARGVDTFGISLASAGVSSGDAIFGRGAHALVERVEELPRRLSELYFRLARR